MPLVGSVMELHLIRDETDGIVAEVADSGGRASWTIPLGTMIELPRAALTAHRIAETAEFFSFGTNDLTQTDLGLLPRRRRGGVLRRVPRQGRLHRVAVRVARRRRRRSPRRASPSTRVARPVPSLHLGVCGEHGGDPESIHFFHEVGLDYVSCSPFRVPVARLEAGRAAITFEDSGEGLAGPR